MRILSLLILSLFFASSSEVIATTPASLDSCELKQELDGQKHYVCSFLGGAKKVNFLELRGKIENTAYYHGKFLAKEIVEGVYAGINERENELLSRLTESEIDNYKTISKCIARHFKHSVSTRFLKMNKNMAKGIRESGYDISYKEMLRSNLMVELSIFFEGIQYQSHENSFKAQMKLLRTCATSMTFKTLKNIGKKLGKVFKGIKFGCTGISVPASVTKNGELILSRNFDTSLLSYFDKYPTMIMHHPDKGHSYVGMAGAGIHYAGGISGMNEKGLTVSLHELSTSRPRISYSAQKTEITPFLLNTVLEKAKNISEAVEIIRATKGFGAWTIFIADSKNNEIASVEMTGSTVSVARNYIDKPMIQTNHYIAAATRAKGFEYSFNKTLESHSRMEHLKSVVKRDSGNIDTQWVVNQMAGHTDFYMGKRSFGRTVTKAYTSMTHIMSPRPREFWFTLGEVYPATSSTFVGVRVSFHGKDRFFSFIGEKKANNVEFLETPDWKNSLSKYVSSFLNFSKGYKDVSYIENAVVDLDEAIDLALKDQVIEVPYYFIRARVVMHLASYYHKNGEVEKAKNLISGAMLDLNFLLKESGSNKVNLHIYQESLVKLWLARSYDLLGRPEMAISLYEEVKTIHRQLIVAHPGHYALTQLMKSYLEGYNWKMLAADVIDFITIE